MVRIADAHLTSAFLKVAFIVSVEGCRFKIKSQFSKLATETTPKQEMWLLGPIYAVPLLVLIRSYFKSLRNQFCTLPAKT